MSMRGKLKEKKVENSSVSSGPLRPLVAHMQKLGSPFVFIIECLSWNYKDPHPAVPVWHSFATARHLM